MAVPVIMPRHGQSVESCIISKWNKKKGDRVNSGDILFSYETDKASFEEEARLDGTLLDIFFDEGEDVPCLINVCVIGNEGESTSQFNPNQQAKTEEAKAVKISDEKKADTAEQAVIPPRVSVASGDEKIRISPRAKNLADKTGTDYRFACPSGPNGRIMERDIAALHVNGPIVTAAAKDEYMKSGLNAISGTGLGGRITILDLKAISDSKSGNTAFTAVPQADYREVKLTNIRKVIAKAMHHSISSTAQLTLNSSFDATEILAFRKKLKESKEAVGLENITLNDILLYTISRTLPLHENLNAHFLDDRMHIFNNVHIGVAVDTERGLMVPTLFNANVKSLNEISREVKKLAEDSQKGTINPDLLRGASFTVTNLGTLDIESFTPVLNPPQTGILGINNIVYRIKQVNDEFVNYPAMGLSLTFDHRALDGAPAARFLKELKKNLENFSALLVK
jgi:pyruvate dehydrogenase E2 component (dihydrolipoamide acetyltransferase)